MWQSLPIRYNQQVRINANHHLQVLSDPSLTGGGGGEVREQAGCVCGRGEEGGEVESELELGDGRKQQMMQLRTNKVPPCVVTKSEELKCEDKIQHH